MTTLQQNLLLGLAGIIVTIGTFWIGYRQTIGVRQERTRSANQELVGTLLKRLVLEGIVLTREQLLQAIAGTASQRRIPVDDLWSPAQLGDVLLARVLEDDLVSAEVRAKLVLDAKAFVYTQPKEASEDSNSSRSKSASDASAAMLRTISVALGALSAAAGALVVLVPSHKNSASTWTAVAAIAVTTVTATFVTVAATYRQSLSRVRVDAPTLSFRRGRRSEVLDTYPDSDAGLRAIDVLRSLSPFAVSALRSIAEDERQSLSVGVPPGLFVRQGGTPWHSELVRAGLLETTSPPESMEESEGRDFVVLTAAGRDAARLLTSRESVPDYLVQSFKNAGERTPDDVSRS